MRTPGKFQRWWRVHQRSENLRLASDRWLAYACKTVAYRGDHNQQRIVYTIAKRFRKSEWPRLTESNAKKIFQIVNKKQQAHRREAGLSTTPTHTARPVIRRTVKKTYIQS